MGEKKLLFIVNDPSFFLSHRLPIAEAARASGYEVEIATMKGPASEQIKQLGFKHHEIPLSRSGRNLIQELVTFVAILRLLKNLQPDILHLVTIKPVLYGGIAARICGIPGVISAISGLGFVFVERPGFRRRILRFIVQRLYSVAMGHPNQRVIFQNPTDMSLLLEHTTLEEEKCRLIRGSGVNLDLYKMLPEPEGAAIIVMASRLLKDKGVYEFVNAAKILDSAGTGLRFLLAGRPDDGNPESISMDEIREWESQGIIEYIGHREDIAHVFSESNIVVLPSYYREGLPKVLIEAAACGRAVITTDMPGCRDAVIPDETGLLVHPRDPDALASSILKLVKDAALRKSMGVNGRQLAEKEFSIDTVVETHLEIYQELYGAK